MILETKSKVKLCGTFSYLWPNAIVLSLRIKSYLVHFMKLEKCVRMDTIDALLTNYHKAYIYIQFKGRLGI